MDAVKVFESGYVSIVNIVEVQSLSALGHLGIGWRELAGRLEIGLKRFLAILSSNIEVDDDVVFRNLDPMQSTGVEVFECGADLGPFGDWGSAFIVSSVLRRAITTEFVESTVRFSKSKPRDMVVIRCSSMSVRRVNDS